MQEIDCLRSAGLFEPEFTFQLEKSKIRKALRDTGVGEPTEIGEPWRDGAPAVGDEPGHSLIPDLRIGRYRKPNWTEEEGLRRWTKRTYYLPDSFLYPSKFSSVVWESMFAEDGIYPSMDGRGFVVDDAGSLARLLAAAACVLHESSHGRLIPDVTAPAQARRIAAPPSEGDIRDVEVQNALILAVRGVTPPNLRTEFRRFIDFRLDERNESARRDYIVQLMNLWKLFSDGGTEHALEEVVRKAAMDVRKAGDSYFKRVGGKTLASQGLTSFAAVIPLAVDQRPALIVSALSMVGASAIPLIVRKGAPRYVRSASKAGLLATVSNA